MAACLIGISAVDRHHDEVLERHEFGETVAPLLCNGPCLLERGARLVECPSMKSEKAHAVEDAPGRLPGALGQCSRFEQHRFRLCEITLEDHEASGGLRDPHRAVPIVGAATCHLGTEGQAMRIPQLAFVPAKSAHKRETESSVLRATRVECRFRERLDPLRLRLWVLWPAGG